MALPEQALRRQRGRPRRTSSAFGVILYEMLIGLLLIEGFNYNQLMYRVLTAEYSRPRI